MEIGEVHISTAVPLDLVRKRVCLVPVVFGGLRQLGDAVAAHIQADIVCQGAGIVVKAKHGGVQQVNKADASQHPACPGDGIPLHDDHDHQAAQGQNAQSHRQHLPDEEIHAAAPGGQEALQGADHIGIYHVHQGGEPLAELHQHPGQGGEYGSGQITAEYLHQNTTPPCVFIVSKSHNVR